MQFAPPDDQLDLYTTRSPCRISRHSSACTPTLGARPPALSAAGAAAAFEGSLDWLGLDLVAAGMLMVGVTALPPRWLAITVVTVAATAGPGAAQASPRAASILFCAAMIQ